MTNRVTDAAGRAATYAGDKLRSASDRTRETTARVRGRTEDAIDSNPLAVIAAGLAVGAIAGALLPRSESERALIGGVGAKVNDTVRAALNAAKEAGRSTLDEHGLNRDAARKKVDKLLEVASKSASAATSAATKAVRSSEQDAG